MDDDHIVHNWVTRTLRNRLSREYKEVFDNLDRQVYSGAHTIPSSSIISIRISELSEGIYFYRIKNDRVEQKGKILVIR